MFKILILSKDSDYSHKLRDIITSWELSTDVIDTIPSSESTTVTLKYDLLIIDYPDHRINIKELKSRFDPVGIVVVIGKYNLLESLTFYELKWVHVHIKNHNFLKTQSFIKSVLELKQNRDLFYKALSDSQEVNPNKYRPYIFKSPLNIAARNRAIVAALDQKNVLLLGESGVGKEILAEIIHRNSDRSKNKMISINCASLVKETAYSRLFGHVKGAFTSADKEVDGLFSAATGSTLFLDEIAEIPEDTQAELLRVLNSKDTTRSFQKLGSTKETISDVRVIAATNNEDIMKSSHHFRRDLLNRFIWKIFIPPLRERKEEIPSLIDHFVSSGNLGRKSPIMITDEAKEFLINFNFKGNIRDLETIIHCSVRMSQKSIVDLDDIEREIKFLPIQ